MSKRTVATLLTIFSVCATLQHSYQEMLITRQVFHEEIKAQKNFSDSNWVSRNRSCHYSFNWSSSAQVKPFRLLLTSLNSAERAWPLEVVAKQGECVVSLVLPFQFVQHSDNGDTAVIAEYTSLAKTICPFPQAPEVYQISNRTVLDISTLSVAPINFSIFATLVEDFVLAVGSNNSRLAELRPSMPLYYWFSFNHSRAALKGARAVRVVVRLPDDDQLNSKLCMVLAVQSSTCPVWDKPEMVDHTSLHQTVLSNGDIYVTEEEFNSFFVILLSYPNDKMCRNSFDSGQAKGAMPYKNATKRVLLKILPAPELNYRTLVYTCVVIIILAFGLALLAVCVFWRTSSGQRQRLLSEPVEAAEEDLDNRPSFEVMSVAVLNRKPTDRHAYCLQLSVISSFYCLPAVQLMWALSNSIYNSGKLDKCFYNYACSVGLKIGTGLEIYSFNNVFSNIGYVVAGCTLIVVCALKKYWTDGTSRTGVPDSYSLYYACGAALVMEGVMSATYHLCPSYYNFQFDTAFMLMIAGLLVLLLYSKRHPDVNATAQIAYLALGAFIFANTLGIIFDQVAAKYIYFILAALHLLLIAYLARRIYYHGKAAPIREIFSRAGIRNFPYPPDASNLTMAQLCPCRPRYPKTLALLIVSGTFNLAFMALYIANGLGKLPDEIKLKLADVFLGIIIMNFLLYLSFYLLIKAFYVKRSELRCVCLLLLLIVLAAVLSGFALNFFFNAPTDWMKSPAESRARNTECVLMNQFDRHDVWHLLSAGAILCVLMLVLCVDINDSDKPREQLPVF